MATDKDPVTLRVTRQLSIHNAEGPLSFRMLKVLVAQADELGIPEYASIHTGHGPVQLLEIREE